MSPSTAPASIDASWPGSPTSTSRASERSASISRAISDSDTIEVSSTITTSCGKPLFAVVAEAAAAAGPVAEQPVDRGRRQRPQLAAHGVGDVEPRRLLVDGLLQSRRGLAGRGGERDQRRALAATARTAAPRSARRSSSCRSPVRRRRPRTGAEPPRRRRGPGRRPASSPNSRATPSAERALVDVGRRCAAHRPQRVGHRDLLGPVAVEVQPRSAPAAAAASGPASPASATSGLAATAASHGSTSGHGSASRSTGFSDSTAAVSADRREVDVHVTEPRRADRQRDRQQHRLVVL